MTALTKMTRWAAARAPWTLPGPAEPSGPALAVGRDTFTGRVLRWELGKSHLLVGGVTGSGKSVALRYVVADAAKRPDVALVAVDCKAVEFSPWAPRLSALAVDQETAKTVLSAVVDELMARRETLLSNHATDWDTRWGPYLVVVVDELSELVSPTSSTKEAKELAADCTSRLETVARMGRALGVILIGCTQRPDAQTVSPQLRGQMDTVIGLRVRRPEESRIIGGDAFDLTTLPRHEAAFIRPLPWPVRTIKADFVDPRSVHSIATATAPNRPGLERLDSLR